MASPSTRTPKQDRRSLHALIERGYGDHPLLVSVDEAAALLRLGPHTVHRFIRDGQIQCLWLGIGKRQIRRIRVNELERFVDDLARQQS